MEAILAWFKAGLLVLGVAVEALALFSAVIAGWWLLLRFADWRGQWMEEHPEEPKKKGVRER